MVVCRKRYFGDRSAPRTFKICLEEAFLAERFSTAWEELWESAGRFCTEFITAYLTLWERIRTDFIHHSCCKNR